MKKDYVVAIIQARFSSTRLPGKVLKPILGKPMLWHLINRINHAKSVAKVVVATSTNKKDLKIVKFCKKNGIDIFTGSEDDVLERIYQAAQKVRANTLIRITADGPLIDPKVVDQTVTIYKKGNYDYVAVVTGAAYSQSKINKYPDGLDCEVFSFASLEQAYLNAKDPLEREHATMFIWKNTKRFKIGKSLPDKDYSFLRLVVDHQDDLKLIRQLYKHLYQDNRIFYLSDIVDLIEQKPKLLKINQAHIGKEGYEQLFKN